MKSDSVKTDNQAELIADDRDKNDSSKKQLAECVRKLIGDRTLRQTAEETGIAVSYLSGIVNERYIPKPEILRKLSSANADPQNGVTYEDLMIAAGYQSDYTIDLKNDSGNFETMMMYYTSLNKMRKSKTSDDKEEGEKASVPTSVIGKSRFYMAEAKKNERFCRKMILASLLEKNISYEKFSYSNGEYFDLKIKLSDYDIDEWCFDFKYIPNNKRIYVAKKNRVASWFSNYLFLEPNKNRKITIVITEKEFYDHFKTTTPNFLYKGDVSLMLIDTENYEIVDEVYLSHYDDDYKKEDEIFLLNDNS